MNIEDWNRVTAHARDGEPLPDGVFDRLSEHVTGGPLSALGTLIAVGLADIDGVQAHGLDARPHEKSSAQLTNDVITRAFQQGADAARVRRVIGLLGRMDACANRDAALAYLNWFLHDLPEAVTRAGMALETEPENMFARLVVTSIDAGAMPAMPH